MNINNKYLIITVLIFNILLLNYAFTEKVSSIEDLPKVALCAMGKNENLYIREWVEYYKKLGINKIILYDNNELNGERFEDVLNDYTKSGFIEIIDRRGVIIQNKNFDDAKSNQGIAYHDCYYNNYKKFNWLCFFDIDEFLTIDYKYKNIYEFLNDFNDYDGIKVQWRMYGDNGNLYYQNKPVIERFLDINNFGYDNVLKSIVKCKHYDFDLVFGPHGPQGIVFVNLKKIIVGGNGVCDSKVYYDLPVYLNHFYCKSTEEFINRKFNKTDIYFGNAWEYWNDVNNIKYVYFKFNNYTIEKEEMFNSLISKN